MVFHLLQGEDDTFQHMMFSQGFQNIDKMC